MEVALREAVALAGPGASAIVPNAPFPINGLPWNSSTSFVATYDVGTVNQLELKRVHAHPFHLHVNHFQLVEPPEESFGGYFQVQPLAAPS